MSAAEQIMESFDNTSSKVRYEIVGHSGEEAEIPLVMEVCVCVCVCVQAKVVEVRVRVQPVWRKEALLDLVLCGIRGRSHLLGQYALRWSFRG